MGTYDPRDDEAADDQVITREERAVVSLYRACRHKIDVRVAGYLFGVACRCFPDLPPESEITKPRRVEVPEGWRVVGFDRPRRKGGVA